MTPPRPRIYLSEKRERTVRRLLADIDRERLDAMIERDELRVIK